MELKINSRKFGEVTFWAPDSGGYVRIDMNGKLGLQICHGGYFYGSTIDTIGNKDYFKQICKKWWRSFLKNQR